VSDNKTATGGISFTGLLTILFIGLKLTHNIDWSWWWVLSPMWITAGLALLVVLFVLVAYQFNRPSQAEREWTERTKRYK
jgi:transmembrane Fragile-X-F protein